MITPTQRTQWREDALVSAVMGTATEHRLALALMDAIDALEDAERDLRAARAQIGWHGGRVA